MQTETILSPKRFLEAGLKGKLDFLAGYEGWWETTGKPISEAVDRAGTPWVRQFDRFGSRIDEILFPPDYWTMLREGYKAGVIWRAFDESLSQAFIVGYVAAFYDTGLYCPYTVSIGTAAAVDKYAAPDVRERFLPPLLRKNDSVWQGATWMTENRGGSDLGATVETVARRDGDRWMLTGDKYFCSNAGAELAVVAARPEGAPEGVRGLALFLLPKQRGDGSLNYHLRRLKDKIGTRSVPTGEVELRDSEAYLLGEPGQGIYHIMEVLNLSRVANSIGSVALAQRAMSDALIFANEREVFGRRLIDQPLMRRQVDDRIALLKQAFALAWESVCLAQETWRELPPRYSDRFNLFRIVTHLAKYWTAEVAVQMAKWAMEVNGGMGTLAEFGVERHLREAMIVDIWEGPPHRQILDGLEAMERKGAHRLLFDHLAPHADTAELAALKARVEAHLTLAQDEKEAGAEDIFRDLAAFTAKTLAARSTVG